LRAAVVTAGGEELCGSCLIADTPLTRMKGLLGRRDLASGEGLLLRPAASVHTAFMRFPIDVAFVDRDMRVIKISENVAPWRVSASRGAKAVLELPAGECARRGIAPGVELSSPVSEGALGRPVGRAAPVRRAAPAALGILLALLTLARFDLTASGALAAFFAGTLGVISVIDFERGMIPNRVVIPATVLVLIGNVALYPDRALEWLLSSLGAGLVLLILAVINPQGLGMGDVKLGLLLGAGLGLQVISGLALGFLVIWPVALYLVIRHGRLGLKRSIAFAPLLSFGALVVLFTAGVV